MQTGLIRSVHKGHIASIEHPIDPLSPFLAEVVSDNEG